ncbi:hypothetical protein [Chthonobacter rhizosphaerae]|uniref:hypothetical protein n=1 Tax=Chthonobacter rhizosphaerae TaxID=2735553 RepID=UPI0015EEF10E|nr:hypothetical protein [Chthonobacter rhizosphaerae]
MALIDIDGLVQQLAFQGGILSPGTQQQPAQRQPQGFLNGPGMSQALLSLGSTLAEANERGYGLGSGLAFGAQAFGNSLQQERDRIAMAEREATRDRMATLKDLIDIQMGQKELNLRMSDAALKRRMFEAEMAKARNAPPQTTGLPEGYMWGTNGQAVPIPGIEGGAIKPEARVFGLQVAEGATPTKDDAAAVKTVRQAYIQLQTLIPEYRGLVEEYGSEIEGSGAANLLQQKQAQIALQVKNLEELGALQEADRAVINDMLGSPVRKPSPYGLDTLNPLRGLPWIGDKDRSLRQIESFDKYIKDRYDTALSNRGYTETTQPPAPQPTAGETGNLSPAEQAELQQLRQRFGR